MSYHLQKTEMKTLSKVVTFQEEKELFVHNVKKHLAINGKY